MKHESISEELADSAAEIPEHASCMPSLPIGYTAQPCAEFSDESGLLLYEFNRVYGPIERPGRAMGAMGAMGAIDGLDEELSFWAVRWGQQQESGDELPAGRWMSYGQARRLNNPPHNFEEFLMLRDEVPTLLHAEELIGGSNADSLRLQAKATQGKAWAAKLDGQRLHSRILP